MRKAQESELVKDEEGDQTFEAGKPAPAPAAAAATGTGKGNGSGAPTKAAPEVQAEGTKRKAEDKDGVDGAGDVKKAKA
jgi:hypothetical protein